MHGSPSSICVFVRNVLSRSCGSTGSSGRRPSSWTLVISCTRRAMPTYGHVYDGFSRKPPDSRQNRDEFSRRQGDRVIAHRRLGRVSGQGQVQAQRLVRRRKANQGPRPAVVLAIQRSGSQTMAQVGAPRLKDRLSACLFRAYCDTAIPVLSDRDSHAPGLTGPPASLTC
jgi:hypothetical protein